MVSAGDTLEHPITREKIVFRTTAHDTDGELCAADFSMPPGAFVAAEHIHPLQEERFTVITGTLRGRVAGQDVVSGPGETVVVPKGAPHVWWNAGDEVLHCLVELRPALAIDSFFETFFGLAQDGKVNPKTGLPNALRLALIMRTYHNEIVLARPPRLVQTLLFGALAPIGRLLGYTGAYPYPHVRQTHTR